MWTQLSTKVDILLHSRVREVGVDDVVQFSTGQNNSEVKAKKFVGLGLPPDQLRTVDLPSVSEERKGALRDAVFQVPLFKLFLEFGVPGKREPWWIKHGFTHGKSTSDLDVRQVHAYDNEDLLIYTSGPAALRWGERFNKNPGDAARLAWSMVLDVYFDADDHRRSEIPEPNFHEIDWHFWRHGSAKWAKGASVLDEMTRIRDDGGKSNVFVLGDSYSKLQGWVEGCLASVDDALPAMTRRLEES